MEGLLEKGGYAPFFIYASGDVVPGILALKLLYNSSIGIGTIIMKVSQFEQKKWDLSDLYPDHKSESFAADREKIEALGKAFESYRPQLKPDMTIQDFHFILAKYEEIVTLGQNLGSFVGLWFSEDTQNPEAIANYAQIEAITTETGNRTLFFNLWWKSLSDEEAARFIQESPDYAYFLESLRLSKPYTLEEKSEQIINIKNMTGASALNNLYESLTNRYQFKLVIDGEEKSLTRGELMVYARDADAEIRKQAYQELYRVYGEDGTILAQIYQSIARDYGNENVQLRGFSSPISVMNLENNIPDSVVDLLLATCQKNKDLFQKYFTLKKKIIGLDVFNRYDLYAPTMPDKKQIPYAEAIETVRTAFSEFDPRFAELAMSIFAADHVDSEVRHGKRGGAFCWTAGPKLKPWVLLNYQGRTDDVSTMAHELGHAVHSLSAAEHNIFEQHACLPLAETASTFAEMVLTDFMLKNETDPAIRRNILMEQMDGDYATIQRQAYFALFERQAHEMILKGADVEALNQAYLENLRDQFGDAILVNDEFKWEWVSIPHIYATPFYVYAYAFGQLLVLSLYRKYKEEGKDFLPKYWKLISAGGSKSPETILKESGFNFHEEAFWQGGFDVLQERIRFLEEGL